mmetsp:Transcript_17483/g.47688  ORF Transcript_17483/g.47688 Transcript_17483/m.47688 type:complete len:1004 (-) Transcript_17483:1972-4983(-)
MTGIADLYVMLKKPHSKQARDRFLALLQQMTGTQRYELTRFIVLSWKRTGSNLLCGILFNHPEIIMHNELFNPIDIFSYYQRTLVRNEKGDRWNTLGRDLYPEAFLEHIWTGNDVSGDRIKAGSKACGFKSFPDHWWEAQNDSIFQHKIMDDFKVKKVVLFREDELAVYLSMKRAEKTGLYMTHSYPKELKIRVDPAAFQIFINNYRDTFRCRYKSTLRAQDTFLVSYEQLVDESFALDILPKLWKFLGVASDFPMKPLRETIKQADPGEDISSAIENYSELEFCFRHTDVKHFKIRKDMQEVLPGPTLLDAAAEVPSSHHSEIPRPMTKVESSVPASWSILLPICSRFKQGILRSNQSKNQDSASNPEFNANRFHDLSVASQHQSLDELEENHVSRDCWRRLESFAASLRRTCSSDPLTNTECVVGIDVDDPVFRGQQSRIAAMIPCDVKFVDIQKTMYGRVCRIWNHLGKHSKNDFIVLFGDDVVLKDEGWRSQVVAKFQEISVKTGLPLGAACVALNDESFPGFPTFPVVHRWHIDKFDTILPRQFVNQGGDPYLYELYSRFDAAAFLPSCRLSNTIGGDHEARYKKHEINWKGQILRLNLMHLKELLQRQPTGICLDVVVPSYRTNNDEILSSILKLQSSHQAYVRFWLVVDNPDEDHLKHVRQVADGINVERFPKLGNYFITVLHYAENRGASFARNFGYNFSSADFVLFLDDDVTPSPQLLDAYIGAIQRYPQACVFVGNTELPVPCNAWTKMLRSCNIMFFYDISKHVPFPPWGVTANLLVRGSRHNNTIQFKGKYPKTGGGEDIDLCFQFKQRYQKSLKDRVIVGVPGAIAYHPWWNSGYTCYKQINGWAWGDALCISEWPDKCFWSFPNWIEFIVVFIPLYACLNQIDLWSSLERAFLVFFAEHAFLAMKYYPSASIHVQRGFLFKAFVACGAGTILSFQEATRVAAHLHRGHFQCLFRRVDWNDGQDPMVKLDVQLGSAMRFVAFVIILVSAP